MAERQQHGILYQNKIISENKLNQTTTYTDKWDGIEEYNNDIYNVSIKMSKLCSNIELGSLKRQIDINEDFILYSGFWKRNPQDITSEYKVLIKKENWNKYLGDISIMNDMLDEMKTISNDKSDDNKWKLFRTKYKKLYGDSIISIRFKRDHKKQKRIQCAISYKNFINVILRENSILPEK